MRKEHPNRKAQPIRGTIERSNFTTKMSVTRTIVPEMAREGQAVNVIYDIVNEGTVSLTNIVLKENKSILADELEITAELKPGEAAQIKLPVVMGTKDLKSVGTITYTIADGTQEQTFLVDEQVITFGETNVIATLSSDTKGVLQNGTINLTLQVENTGDFDYTDVRVVDATLGDVFTNQTLPAGETLTLEKEITLTQTTDFQFEVFATDNAGVESSYLSNMLNLIAVNPEDALNLDISFSANKTEVYSDQEVVRFTVTVANNSTVDASKVTLYQADTEMATFVSIPAGESRTFSRDVTLSMAGQYQFNAEATDALENAMTFESNILQIAFLTPTPAPITPNPNVTPTPEPTFVKATYPKISDPDIGTLPKLIRTFFYPLMIGAFGLFIVALVILLIATKKRSDVKKASENALDHLERSSHRDYVIPADEQETQQETPAPDTAEEPVETDVQDDDRLSDDELPHMKYVRNAYQIAGRDNAQDEPSDPYADSTDPDVSKDDYAWNTTSDSEADSDAAPSHRRTGRRSPYARQPNDEDQDSAPAQDNNTEDPF